MKLVPHPTNLCSKYATKMLSIRICQNCNGNCKFCVDKDGYKTDVTDVNAIVRAAKYYMNYETVIITGGEPFLVFEDVLAVLKGLRPHKDRLVLNTNGSLLTQENVQRLTGLIDELQVSVHNPDEVKNASVFGLHIAFSDIEKALKGARFDVSINSTFNDSYQTKAERHDMLHNMLALCRRFGANKLRLTELKKVADPLEAKDFGFKSDITTEQLICKGCTEYQQHDAVTVSIKRLCEYAKGKGAIAFSCCFLDEKGQMKIEIDTRDTFKVIYGDGTVTDDWIFDSGLTVICSRHTIRKENQNE